MLGDKPGFPLERDHFYLSPTLRDDSDTFMRHFGGQMSGLWRAKLNERRNTLKEEKVELQKALQAAQAEKNVLIEQNEQHLVRLQEQEAELQLLRAQQRQADGA